MPAVLPDRVEVVAPTEDESRLAREAEAKLKAQPSGRSVRMQIMEGEKPGETLPLPDAILRLVLRIISEVAHGASLALAPVAAELRPRQAAEILNVSRPYLTGLLHNGEIPFRKVGAHHRIRLADVLRYKDRIDRERLKALSELAAEAQELGMGY